MKAVLLKKLRRLQAQQGFTLLEILVVLTIMGFLIAMVAPRLAGISGGAVDTVCDSNQNRMVSYLGAYFEKTNRFPDKLTNLVEELDNAAAPGGETYQIPAVSDDDPENGPETLASDFFSRNHFRIHYLSTGEVAELKSMGIVNLFNLNAYDGLNEAGAVKTDYTQADGLTYVAPTNAAPTMEMVTLNTDVAALQLAVAMVGMGKDAGDVWQASAVERGWGEPDFLGRIVLGMGPESGLVTSGIIANAAHCPGGIQNADNVTYNDYNVVLPRLAATAGLIVDGVAELATAGWTSQTAATLAELAAIAYDDAPTATAYDIAANDDNYRYRTFDITVAQESYQYATQCPEGHMYPEDDGEFWGISLDGDSTLD